MPEYVPSADAARIAADIRALFESVDGMTPTERRNFLKFMRQEYRDYYQEHGTAWHPLLTEIARAIKTRHEEGE